jgi:hypothetical protein
MSFISYWERIYIHLGYRNVVNFDGVKGKVSAGRCQVSGVGCKGLEFVRAKWCQGSKIPKSGLQTFCCFFYITIVQKSEILLSVHP